MSKMLNRIKLRSFGIVEAVVASGIVVVLISGAVALSSSSLRSTTLNSAYFEAEHIADDLMEGIYSAKLAGKVFFDDRAASVQELNSNLFSIDCFTTKEESLSTCNQVAAFREVSPYENARFSNNGVGQYVVVNKDDVSPAFSDAFYSWNIKVKKPTEMEPPIQGCRALPGSDGSPIPDNKCRFVEIDVKWTESSGDKHYYLTQYFADWER